MQCLCTPHKRALVGEERREVHTRLFCILCQGVWGWVFAGVNEVVCVYGEGRAVLSSGWDEVQLGARDRLFIAKTEMALRYRGVVGREVGVKCFGVQDC